jgi:MFS family permease
MSESAANLSTKQLERRVILASSLGTMFEWYDFFLYGTLAALLGKLFFPSDNPTAALLASLATFGAGFGVRPLGAVVFGVLGDRIGRKSTFLVTITLMGLATAMVGILPTYASAGIWAPVMLVALRMLQGLALGGEYGGAAIYVAEHAPTEKRGLHTSWIQASVVVGFLLSLMIVLACQTMLTTEQFHRFGWRIPFLLSLIMLAISLYMRLKLRESPVFSALQKKGEVSRAPLREAFASRSNVKNIFVALVGVSAGFTVIFYTAQFSSQYFLQGVGLLDEVTTKLILGGCVIVAAPFFVVFGALGDRVGRRKVLLWGYALTLLTLFPLFKGLSVEIIAGNCVRQRLQLCRFRQSASNALRQST